MTFAEIRKAIQDGKRVFWNNQGYEIKQKSNDYIIRCCNGSIQYLTSDYFRNGSNDEMYIGD
ncbi:MAG: hypothetical protein Q8T08_26250 [Ignavibacteria bacterium]|nr:hypothetical protein [Ignavibacteria bacterium]